MLEKNDKKKSFNMFPIPTIWRPLIVTKNKEDHKKRNTVEGLAMGHGKLWNWLYNYSGIGFETILFVFQDMAEQPAILISDLVSDYLLETTGDFVAEKSKENAIRKRFTRALRLLIRCGLMKTKHIDAVESGRFSACIYIAPFAEEKDIQEVIIHYQNIGGGGKKKKEPMSEDEYATKMANRGPLIRKKKEIMEKPSEVAYCEKCNTEYTVKFTGERCMNCDDNFSRISILKRKKIET